MLIILALLAGCESNQKQTVRTPSNAVSSRPAVKGASFAGGDGSSITNAVIVRAPDAVKGILAEYEWIKNNHPDWQLKEQSVLNLSGRVYDKIIFLTPEGRPATLYFDITDFFGKQ